MHTEGEVVVVTATLSNASEQPERVRAYGRSLTEGIENLVIRFKQLQDAALEELRFRGFITVTQREALS